MQTSMTPYQPGANVDATTALLIAMKEKGELQNYVAAHKGKPEYPSLLALASSINNVSQASEAAKYAPPAQTVADQRLAALAPPQPQHQQMPQGMGMPQGLPEDAGIGRLPAPNLQKMADGGIAGYSDGELIADNSPVVRMAGGGVVAFGDGGKVPGYATGGPLTSADVQAAYRAWQATMPSIGANQTLTGGAQEARAKDNYMRVLQAYQTQPSSVQPGAGQQLDQQIQAPNYDAATQARGLAILSAMRDQAALQGQGGQNQTVAAPKPDGGISSLFGDQGAGAPSTGGFMGDLEKILGKPETVPSEEDTQKKLQDIQKPFFESITKKVDEQRSKLKSDREDAIYMALIKGGLAAAAGTSPNALTNIAKGGEAGAADFGESLKDLRKAAQEQSKMELELDKAKMDASTGNLKTAWDRTDKANQHNMERNKALATGYTTLTDAAMRSNATVKAAGIGATAGQRELEALGRAAPDSALRKGFDLKQEMMKRATLTETWSKLAYPSGNMGQPNEAFLARFPSAEVYIKEAMAAEQPGAGGAGGPNAGLQRAR